LRGQANALAFAESLSGAGLCIVSGLALGIDAVALEPALDLLADDRRNSLYS